jgi:Tol biopolymer transport system component
MRKPIVIAAIVAATAAAIVAAVPSHATLPGRNGRILYQATVGKHVQLFTVRADGTGRRQVTHFADSDAVNAEWAPDGRRIAFERDFADRALILTMKADGSDKRTLTPSGLQGMPAYSPDGATIVFDRTLGEENKPSFDDALWLMDTNGGNLRRLTAQQAPGHIKIEGQPEFAPDGRTVVFSRTESDTRSATFVVNPDGTGERQLSPWDLGSYQTHFSPDGRLIAFNSYPDAHPKGVSSNVFVMNTDGTGRHALTHLTGGVRNAGMGSFSPDGRSIGFAKWTLKKDGPLFSVWTMRADGSHARGLPGTSTGHVVDWGRRP